MFFSPPLIYKNRDSAIEIYNPLFERGPDDLFRFFLSFLDYQWVVALADKLKNSRLRRLVKSVPDAYILAALSNSQVRRAPIRVLQFATAVHFGDPAFRYNPDRIRRVLYPFSTEQLAYFPNLDTVAGLDNVEADLPVVVARKLKRVGFGGAYELMQRTTLVECEEIQVVAIALDELGGAFCIKPESFPKLKKLYVLGTHRLIVPEHKALTEVRIAMFYTEQVPVKIDARVWHITFTGGVPADFEASSVTSVEINGATLAVCKTIHRLPLKVKDLAIYTDDPIRTVPEIIRTLVRKRFTAVESLSIISTGAAIQKTVSITSTRVPKAVVPLEITQLTSLRSVFFQFNFDPRIKEALPRVRFAKRCPMGQQWWWFGGSNA